MNKLVAIAALFAAGSAQAAGFAAGDLVVYRVGSVGNSGLSSAATQVYLDEYTKAGSLVQSIAMPTTVSGSNGMLTDSGTATSDGMLTTSANGKYIVLTGYNAALGTTGITGSTTASVARTVGVVNVSTGLADTTTKLTTTGLGGNNIRSAATTNGTDLWVGSAANGVSYTTIGSSTSTQLSTTVTNVRNVEIFNGQLYASDSSGSATRLGTVGSGLPTTTGQTITSLPGFSASAGSPYAYFLADLSTTVAGMDTLYVADDAAGITKYSLIGGSWTAKGTVGTAADTFRGLTGSVDSQGNVSLFATGSGGSGATGGGKLVTFSDASGATGTFSGTGTTIATALTNTAFRGVALIPVVAVPETDTYAMLLSGLGIIGFIVRRRT